METWARLVIAYVAQNGGLPEGLRVQTDNASNCKAFVTLVILAECVSHGLVDWACLQSLLEHHAHAEIDAFIQIGTRAVREHSYDCYTGLERVLHGAHSGRKSRAVLPSRVRVWRMFKVRQLGGSGWVRYHNLIRSYRYFLLRREQPGCVVATSDPVVIKVRR